MLTSSGKSLWGRRVVCRLCPLIAAWLICGAGFVGASGTETLPETLDGLRPFCRKVMSWPCRGIGVTATLSIFCDESTPVPDRGYRYGVVYFINGNFPRIGTESDATILRDFLCRDGHWVVVVDFKNHPRAKTPDFDQDLLALYRDIYREEDAGILSGTGLQPPKFFRIFLVFPIRIGHISNGFPFAKTIHVHFLVFFGIGQGVYIEFIIGHKIQERRTVDRNTGIDGKFRSPIEQRIGIKYRNRVDGTS